MKKYRKYYLALTLLLLLAPVVQSCLDDDDNYYLAIATFRVSADEDPYFVLDEGEKMFPDNGTYSKLEDGQRVHVYFDILEEKVNGRDYKIHVRGLEKVLTKDLFTMDEETVDSIGDDKINIHGMWFGDGYLNIQFKFYGSRNPSQLHMVNLVRNTIEGANENEEEGYLSLEFRHNAYDDYDAEILPGIVSFKGPFAEEGIKGLKIRYKSIYDGIQYKKIDFNEQATGKSPFGKNASIPEVPIAQ